MSERWQNLIHAMRKFPGVGPKMAERLALHVMRSDDGERIVRAIADARENLHPCTSCGVYTEVDPCERCTDRRRDQDVLCIVEELTDLEALERSGAFRGQYHLLGGALSPLDGVGPKELRIDHLMKRLGADDVRIDEVILATNPTVEGEATATYLSQIIQPLGKRVTRLAYGLPSGMALEYADELTICRAFEGRKEI
jgi:recombination protein RecR